MGELWRSQEMQLVQLFIQIEAAHDTVDELGKLGLIQFRDLNPQVNPLQRNFVAEVKRADEMERKLRFLETQIEKANSFAEPGMEIELPEIKAAGAALDGSDADIVMDELEAKLEDLEKELQQMNNNHEQLVRNHNELTELKYVLQKDDEFFYEAGHRADDFSDDSYLLRSNTLDEVYATTSMLPHSGVKLAFLTGVIDRGEHNTNFQTFERVLFRATRGNLFMRYTEIEEPIRDPKTGELHTKLVFIIFFQGDHLQAKIKKICESFNVNLYPCPESANERKNLLAQVNARLDDLRVVISRTLEHRRSVLASIAPHLPLWTIKVQKEKSIYHTMNLFDYDLGRRCLIAEGWCPKTSIEEIQLALRKARDRSGALVPSILSIIKTNEQPPTYFKVNKFTKAFQNIVDAYGVARYREINPAVFSIITFPFMFGVMFGDVGHGLMLLAAVLYFIYKEKQWSGKQLNEMIAIPFEGRYVILLMAIFGIYCGFIYNEFFSIPMDIFGSNWRKVDHHYELIDPNWTYPFGVDPVWKGAGNELIYYNSLKMKLSIILGVLQMSLGIVLKALNASFFGNFVDVWFEFLPQILLLLSLFGYLVIMMFIKWLTPYAQNDALGLRPGTQEAPLLLNTMIYMFLQPFKVDTTKSPKLYDLDGDSQGLIQGVLLVIAAISIPWMLLPKPFILRHRARVARMQVARSIIDEEDSSSAKEHEEEFDFGEVFIHQLIETIEFVLGSVSNTASYLRLWALSLAHSELSTVFWNMGLIKLGLGIGPIGVIIIYAVWFGATVGVLLVMETLSAFLHALRLHWVEFQNKFYKGDGKKFLPFSYERMFSGEDE